MATSSATTASGGALNFTFPALGTAVNFVAGEAMTLEVTTAQTGVAFTIDYDSTTKPSKITLPTTTVIAVDSLGVYDAPYPGGALISTPASGTTVYVRSTASDPFGHADITSMGLSIDGPGTGGDVSTTLGAGQVVATTTGAKTYEYAWTVGLTTGVYNLAVTAHEGTEGIQATSATTVTVTQLDLGTPSTTEFTTGSNGPGTPTYAGNEAVYVRVTDLDQNTNAGVAETISVVITSLNGDQESLILTETGVDTGIFVAGIPASTSGGLTPGDSTLHAVLGEVLHVVYVDPDDSSDTSNDTATIPNTAPALSVNKTLVSPADGQAVVGEGLVYSVQVTNTGNSTLSTVSLTDTFPVANLGYVTASVAPTTVSSGSVAWANVGPLSPGQSTSITLTFTALASAAPAINTAAANGGGGVTGGDTANVIITNPALVVTKTLVSPTPGPASIGDDVVFQINLQNTGDTLIPSVPLEDTYSGAAFDFVSATVAPSASGSGSLLWLDVTGGSGLAPGGSLSVNVTLRARGAAAPAVNEAAVNFAVDVNGDPVPPVNSTATITLLAATISGHVYDDVDESVTFNGGDGVLEDITVSLYTDPNGDGNPADGTLVAVAVTGADGGYDFVNLAVGDYVVVESQPPGYSSSGDTQGANDNRIVVEVDSLSVFAGNNFFDYLTPAVSYASITGTVWNDADGNALAGGGENGLENVTVNLVEDTNGNGSADPGEPVMASTLTAADGSYSFTGLGVGSYVVVEQDLFGWYSTADAAGVNNNQVPVTLIAGQNETGRDFLDVYTGSLGARVFHDVNANGSYDAGTDSPIAGVDVSVTNVYGVAQTVVTDVDGNWTATVPPGLTTVDVQQGDPQFVAIFPTGYLQTAGTDPSTVVAVSSVSTPAGDDGFRQAAGLNGHLYIDTNGDGDQDGGEPDLANVDVLVTDSSGTPQTVTTDTSGNWTAQVAPGTTTVDVQQADPQFPAGAVQIEGDDPTEVEAVANVSTDGGTDGFFVPATVTGHLYLDVNGNGAQDGGEPDLGGVDVLVTDSNGDPQTAVTNGSGNWSALVPPGSTTANVVETDPQFTAVVLTSTYRTYVQTQGNDPTTVMAIAGTSTDAGIDGYFNPTVVYGHLFVDTDGDGTQSLGEPDLENVSVLVTDANGVPQTVSTNASGNWSAVVVPGTTTVNVTETDPDFTSVVPLGNYLQTAGSDPSVIEADAYAVTFAGHDGYFIPGTVTGHLYLDINGNGMQEILEPNLPDVDVLVTDSMGHEQTVATNSAGNWTVLVLGGLTTANVDETDPDFLAHVPLGSPKTEGDDPTTVLAVVNTTVDGGTDGWTLSGIYSISGQVRDDYDEDGVLTDNDTPVPGVTIMLWLDFSGDGVLGLDDALIGTRTTDALGGYIFTGLPNGRYVVQEVNPQGSTSTADASGANDDLIPVVIADADSVAEDFLDAVDPAGYAYDTITGEIVPGGTVTVSGPGVVTIVQDGSSGQYSFLTDGTVGSYVITYFPPLGYVIDPTRPVAGASFDPTGGPNPTSIGSEENPSNPGYLIDKSAGANPYYLTFALAAGDPLVINNNIPLRLQVPKKYVYWKEVTPGGGPTPGSNGDGDCYSDVIEYALNLNPATGVQTAPVFRGVHNPGTGKVDVAYNRVVGGLDDITYSLVGLTDLTASPAGWTPLTLVPVITPNGDGTETVTYADVESDPFFAGHSQGLVRLKVDYDENTDTVADATATTPVFGWTRRMFDAECVMTGYPYLKGKLFCGTVDGVTGSVVDVTTSAGGTSVVAQFQPGRQYFVEVYSGDHAGQRFDIDEVSSTANGIAIDVGSSYNTLPAIPPTLTGDKVVIREHHTMDDLFNPEQFSATTNPTTGDRLLFYDRSTAGFRIYWLLNHISSGTHRWILTGDAGLSDQGTRVIAPDEGWFTHPKGGPQEVVWCGMVRANAFAAPLQLGLNFVGSGYPMNQSPAMRGMTMAAGFTGNRNPILADQLLFWKGYNTDQSMAYYNHFLLSAGALQYWTEQGNALLTNENSLPLFKPTTGSVYKMRNALPGYLMPMPWTP